MRTLTLVCTLLLLTSCGLWTSKPKEAQAPGASKIGIFGSDESSPIVIADGSIHVNQGKKGTHFRVHGPKHSSIKLANYQPFVLGYGCNAASDAASLPCSATQCAATPGNASAGCAVNVNPSDSKSFPDGTTWTLAICDTAACPAATMRWDNKDHETIHITYAPGTFSVTNPGGNEGNGADLQNVSANHLQSASLQISYPDGSSTSYAFSCPANIPTYPNCLTLAYECHLSGNGNCGK